MTAQARRVRRFSLVLAIDGLGVLGLVASALLEPRHARVPAAVAAIGAVSWVAAAGARGRLRSGDRSGCRSAGRLVRLGLVLNDLGSAAVLAGSTSRGAPGRVRALALLIGGSALSGAYLHVLSDRRTPSAS